MCLIDLPASVTNLQNKTGTAAELATKEFTFAEKK